jgi:hypothetical protein
MLPDLTYYCVCIFGPAQIFFPVFKIIRELAVLDIKIGRTLSSFMEDLINRLNKSR